MTNYNFISFYKKGEDDIVIEYLVDHINTMIDILDEKSKVIVYGENIFNSLFGNHVSYYELVISAILFHDIGKAFYKDLVDKAIKYRWKYSKFVGHEIISAIIMDEVIKTLNERYPSEYRMNMFTPTMYSILFHHHALSIRNRLFKVVNYIGRKTIDHYLTIIDQVLDDYSSINIKSELINSLMELIGESRYNLAYILINALSSYNNINRIFMGLNEGLLMNFLSGNKLMKKLMHLTLSTIVCLDYEAARRKRGTQPTSFGQMCMKWLKHYLVSNH